MFVLSVDVIVCGVYVGRTVSVCMCLCGACVYLWDMCVFVESVYVSVCIWEVWVGGVWMCECLCLCGEYVCECFCVFVRSVDVIVCVCVFVEHV